MTLIDSLKWRYATKKFDPTKKVSETDLATIKEAIRLSASSFGLQLYKVMIIEDKEVREKLKESSWGQAQITDASHLLVFCSYSTATDEHIDEFMKLKKELHKMDDEAATGYAGFIKGFLTGLSPDVNANWTAKQCYITLTNLLAVCAEMRIDSCPMEGFDANQYSEILGLKEKGLTPVVLATIGYRSTEDELQHAPKVRKSTEDLFISL